MNQKLWTKVLASLLVMTLTCANFILLGVYASNTYATTDHLENQQTVTNNENVMFDAYFTNEKGNSSHTIRENMSKQDLKLHLLVQVKKGYLKNANIQVLGENNTNSNMKIKRSDDVLEYIENINETTNQIALKQINSGTQIVLEIPVVSSKEDNFDISSFSKINDIVLTGAYVGDNGKEVSIKKTIQTRNEWIGEANGILEQQLVRFIPYQIGEKTGTIVQTLIRSGIQNNTLPIEQTNIVVTVPKVNEKNPVSVNVTVNGILATNAKGVDSFSKENWDFDTEKGSLTITTKNEQQNNQVSWLKGIQDEYIITYIYEDKIDTLQAIQKVTSEIKAYNSVETKISNSHELVISNQEALGQIVTGNIQIPQAISKGYLYTKLEKETPYEEKVTIDVSYPALVDALEITQDMDYFVNGEGVLAPTSISDNHYAYYKTTKISKKNLETMLGEEGRLNITTLNGDILATFNKETQVDENGDYVFNYEGQINQIKIQTTAPIITGKLEIRHEKMLKGNTAYNKQQVEGFKTLQVATNIEAKVGDTIVSNVIATNAIELVAPTTKIEASVSNENLSTVVTNENVELRVILKSNDITCDLYKNPTVEIVLPQYIKQINIKDVNLLFDDELTIKNYNSYVNSNGNIVLVVNMEGEQTKYNTDEISKGANLIINTDITLKQLTPTSNDIMKVYVVNEQATSYEQMEVTHARSMTNQRGYSQTPLRAVAPVGIVTTNSITGYNTKKEAVTSMSSQEQVGQLEVRKEAKQATVSMSVINNYANVVNHVSILGRIPTTGSKNADTNEDFGSNLALQMASQIQLEGIAIENLEIYYSTNSEATKDVTLASNAWSKTVENLAEVKSYLIVVNSNMATGTVLNFSYNVAIPENLTYNMQAYANYVVYFDNIKPEGAISEKAVATKVGVATGEGPELEVAMTSDMEGKEVEEGKIITYTVTVKNVGKSEVRNVIVNGSIPENTNYIYFVGDEDEKSQVTDSKRKTYTQTIDVIKPNETKTIQYQVETYILPVIETENGQKERAETAPIEAQAQVSVENFADVFTSNKVTSTLVQGYINATISITTIPASYPRDEGETVNYLIEIKNVNHEIKDNVKVICQIPKGLVFKKSNKEAHFNQENNILTWSIGTLQPVDSCTILADFIVTGLEDGEYGKGIANSVTVKTKDREIKSNEVTVQVQKPRLSVLLSSQTKQEVTVGNEIIYNIVVRNTGKGPARDIVVTDFLPEGLVCDSVQYSLDGKNYQSSVGNNNVKITATGIKAEQALEITLRAKVEGLKGGESRREVENIVKVEAEGMAEMVSNKVRHTIVAKQSGTDDPSTGDNLQVEGTYSISGIAWIDQNSDGKRDEQEPRMPNMPVMLINADNGQIVKDVVTGKDKKQNTTLQGEYHFANLKPGNYMVIFLYEAGNYGVTLYKQEGVTDDKNSDAVQMKVTYEGTNRLAGVSDKLSLDAKNITNIDIGLVVSPKFDLRLDKFVSKITVSDVKGNNVYEYKDEKVAKLDLNSKTANGSTIMVEYKIRVTNEGAVAGYAKKIVDYLPTGMKFSSELNQEWYTSSDGTNLYNSSLANTLIKPGETKEVTLLLTKKITDSNMGIINNTAEIAESYNDLGLADMDSTPANKIQNEDDYSSADVIVGIKTGEIYMYILLATTTVAILAVGIYLIKKKVLKKD